MLYIKNAKILTMSEKNYENGYISVKDGKISGMGQMSDMPVVSDSDTVIDASGMVLMPGLVDSHCHIGMIEDSVGLKAMMLMK